MGDTLLAGPLQVLGYSYFRRDFPDTFRTAGELRAEIAGRHSDPPHHGYGAPFPELASRKYGVLRS